MANKPILETQHHVVPINVYFKVLLALFVLMALTVYVAADMNPLPSIGPISGTVINQMIAMIIAVIKAALVVLFFMGVKWSTQLTKLWALLGFAWLTFFTIMAGDYGTRRFEPVQGWEGVPASGLPKDPWPENAPLPPANDLNVRPRQ
jgi:cytochrome c oxidase subunit 4